MGLDGYLLGPTLRAPYGANDYNSGDVTSYGGNVEKGAKSLGSSEGDGGGAKHIEGIEAEENQAESNV